MLDSLRELLGTVAGLAHTRVEVLGAELREELERAAGLVLGGLAVLVLGTLGVAFGGAAVLIAAGESYRLAAAAALGAVFFAAAGFVYWRVQGLLKKKPRPFDVSLRALEHDAALARGLAVGVAVFSLVRRLRRSSA